ncbi:MAG: hypothetical protein ACLVJZ_04840 [[Clostridium] leptum]
MVRRYGETALLVTDDSKPMAAIAEKVMQLLQKSGISLCIFAVLTKSDYEYRTEGARNTRIMGLRS